MNDKNPPDLRILLADTNHSGIAALSLLFNRQEGVRVVSATADTGTTKDYIFNNGADLLILDWDLPATIPGKRNGSNPDFPLTVPNLINAIRSKNDQICIIVLTLNPEIEPLALNTGANCVIGKREAPQIMLATLIEQVQKQQAALSRSFLSLGEERVQKTPISPLP